MKTYSLQFPPRFSWVMCLFMRYRTWWQRRMGWLPVFQLEAGFRSPGDFSGVDVPWWCPFAYAGINNIPALRQHGFCANCEIAWLGVYVATGVAIQLKWFVVDRSVLR